MACGSPPTNGCCRAGPSPASTTAPRAPVRLEQVGQRDAAPRPNASALVPRRSASVEQRDRRVLLELHQVGAGVADGGPQPVEVAVEVGECHTLSPGTPASGGAASGRSGSSPWSSLVQLVPGAVGAELLEHGVDEPDEVGVLVGDGDAVVRHRVVAPGGARHAPRSSGPAPSSRTGTSRGRSRRRPRPPGARRGTRCVESTGYGTASGTARFSGCRPTTSSSSRRRSAGRGPSRVADRGSRPAPGTAGRAV